MSQRNVSAATILADPRWLPHSYDSARGTLGFLRVPRERLNQPAFLADLGREVGYESAEVPLAALGAPAPPADAPVTFIFHTAFCRSTLLVRALEQPGISTGLSEPGIIASLAGAGAAGQGALAPVAALLARPWGAGEAVFIKPTNHANRLGPGLMQALPQARAVLMTNPLPSFLAAVVRKGMMGRRWGRQLYLELMSYAGMDLGMDAREQFAMTDLQATALAWFLNQRFLAALASNFGARVRVLDGEALAWRDAPAVTADETMLRPPANPFSADGGMRLVTGNLGRATFKTSAVDASRWTIEAPCRVFETQEAVQAAFKAGELGLIDSRKLDSGMGVHQLNDCLIYDMAARDAGTNWLQYLVAAQHTDELTDNPQA